MLSNSMYSWHRNRQTVATPRNFNLAHNVEQNLLHLIPTFNNCYPWKNLNQEVRCQLKDVQ